MKPLNERLSAILNCIINLVDWRQTSVPGQLLNQLAVLAVGRNELMSPSNQTRDERSPIIGKYTQYARMKMLRLFIVTLWDCGYRVQYLDNISVKHVKAAIDVWVQKGLATRTLQTRLAAIRMMFAWLNREGALPKNKELLPRHHQKCKNACLRDKTWIGNGLDVREIVSWVPIRYNWIRLSLQLQRYFGMRVNESMLFHPHEGDEGDQLAILWGSKGGRPRRIPITTDLQRDILNRCKAHVPYGEAIIGKKGEITRRRARRQYDYILNDMLGITRKNTGVVSHGLRAEFLCELYFKMTGQPAPCRGGELVAPEVDLEARKKIAEYAGHNRASISIYYVGPVLRAKKKQL